MADTIKIGNLDISSFKVGSDDCKVYLGDIELYPQSSPETWTLVDDTFSSPTKIKVDYSLIDENGSEYAVDTTDGFVSIIYINQDIVDYIINQGGQDYSDYIGMVALFSSSMELEEVLDDGVEYLSLGVLDFSGITIVCNNSSPYLYAQ